MWTPDLGRAYVIRFNERRPEEILVRTVLVPDVSEPAAWRKQLLGWLRSQQGAEEH